jgi:hypothetical protein
MPETLLKKRVKVKSDGRVATLPGRYRAEVDREAGSVVLFDSRQQEFRRLDGAQFEEVGRALVASAESETWTLETSRCDCGG